MDHLAEEPEKGLVVSVHEIEAAVREDPIVGPVFGIIDAVLPDAPAASLKRRSVDGMAPRSQSRSRNEGSSRRPLQSIFSMAIVSRMSRRVISEMVVRVVRGTRGIHPLWRGTLQPDIDVRGEDEARRHQRGGAGRDVCQRSRVGRTALATPLPATARPQFTSMSAAVGILDCARLQRSCTTDPCRNLERERRNL